MAVDKNGKQLPPGITQRPDGRYMGRFTYLGERYTLYDNSDPKRLRKAMEGKRYELEHGLHGKIDNITVDKWAKIWLTEYKDNSVKPSTYVLYENRYKWYISPQIGKLMVKDIKNAHIQKIVNSMKSQGYSRSTIKKAYAVISDMMNYAVKNDMIPKNPCTGVVIPKEEPRERRVMSAEEQEQFEEYMRGNPCETIFVVALYTGMRIGDADGKISLNQQKPSKHAGLRRFGPEKFLQRNNEFMKERPIFYKKPIKTEKDFSTWLRCFYYTTKAVITEYTYF